MAVKVIIITGGTAVTLPADWNSSNNSIEVIGGGAGGARRTATAGGAGGPGGGYAKITNFGTANQSLTIRIGTGGAGGSTAVGLGVNTWISNTAVAPTSTTQGALARGGGQATTQIGATTFLGGSGGARSVFNGTGNDNGGGGGGAAGPTGAGVNGVAATSGGGGAGGRGSQTAGGLGGAANNNGSSGAQYTATTTTISGTNIITVATAGAGGGGGGSSGSVGGQGGAGGLYGAGGGGGSYTGGDAVGYNGGGGRGGMIVLTYTTASLPSTGPISLANIQTQFGGADPIGINEYYAGGGLTPAGTSGINGAVPTSGQIGMDQFRGAG